ncbi:MAG: GMC family oxidoreductase [Rhodoferax sp.]|jgi:choline dehydrogenase-like flavoprotein|uniref:FAD-dependent oxidoreductase n=1 Tax=Rhodoferax sp. TaxID=50421 RepID=UPI001B66ACA2|nr:GMC family oxidoreductase [Rhodoferax sp.]MBP9148084.1 GMC family oxidoreductase [Rhodoferax sp.]MBP9736745.1 GMC family oxidoreductase [Rhodoferax sp.]
MFIDTRKLEESTCLDSTLCIVGGGVAGITLALEMMRHGIDTILLESGGFKPDSATRDLYRGSSAGLPYAFADGCRSRFLGGSSNCWGGWCRPLQAHDMAERAWVPNSGWPFGIEELTPYYQRAHPVLQLGPLNYDVDYWTQAIKRPDVRRIVLPSGRVLDSISQFSPPTRFGQVYRDALTKSTDVKVYLNANVVDIETHADGRTVQQLHVRTLSGRNITVRARQFVLAAGGIENPRLLLAANKQQQAGLGNSHDLVGRYFMDHPRLMLGSVKYAANQAHNKLYDIKFHYLNKAVSANGTCVAAQFAISPEVQQREGLMNAQLWFDSVFPGEGTQASEAVIRMKHRLHAKVDPDFGFWADMGVLAKHPVNTASFVLARLLHPRSLIRDVTVQVICEPPPERDSRVTLSEHRDALGMPRAKVSWRLDSEILKRTFDRSLQIFAEELKLAGVADVALPPPIEGHAWPQQIEGTWHHSGTTRMNDSPALGVVDRHCLVHGMGNLYVAGSSVFPTSGANFPTISIAAMTLRLADHLHKVIRHDV